MDNEIWIDEKGWEGIYQISNVGNVRSLNHIVIRADGVKINIIGRILMQAINKYGYSHVTFWLNRKQSHKKVHLMVARNFIHNPNNYKQVHHKDGNKQNNHYTNLEWVDNRENCTESHEKTECTSKYTGVSWHSQRKKWVAQAYINGKHFYLGIFAKEEDASLAYQNKLREHGIVNRYASNA